MKPTQIAKTIAQGAFDTFEAINNQTAKPMLEETAREFGFGSFLGNHPRALAQEDLERARNAQKLEKDGKEDNQKSKERARALITSLQQEYKSHEQRTEKYDQQVAKQVEELKQEVVGLAKAAGVDTKIHLENTPQKGKVSLLTIKLLTAIIKTLKIKAEESKSAKELVAQRANAKPQTGMLAWVSGKQMKVHEQGTLQLQG